MLDSKSEARHNPSQAYNKSIMLRGIIYGLVNKLFGIIPNIAGGVSWYLELEKIDKMDQMGVERIKRALIKEDEAGNLSERSVKKMKSSDSTEKIAITSVKFAAV